MKTSTNLHSNTTISGNRNQGLKNALNGLDLDVYFKFSTIENSSDTLKIVPKYTLNGDQLTRIPIRMVDNTRNASATQHYITLDEWLIDLASTTIDLSTKVGGIVDDIAPAASTDYLVWAFFDPTDRVNSIFRGFGLTTRPIILAASVTGTITKGTSGTITVGTGHGFRFTVGARVIARVSAASGSVYNQGTILSNTDNTITVLADADYGVTYDNNSDLTGTVDVWQLDKFEPRMYNDNSLYPGSGTEYTFKYMGHIQTDASTNVNYFRYRGDPYYFTTIYLTQDQSAAALTNYTYCLSRWVGRHVQHTYHELSARITAGTGLTGYVAVGLNNVISFHIIVSATALSTSFLTSGKTAVKKEKNTINLRISPPTATTVRGISYLFGYDETEF